MVSETLELIIRTTGAGSAAGEIDRIGVNARAATTSLNAMNESLAFMRKTLVALSFLRVFEGIAAGISQAQQMNNQLQQIARTAADIPKAFDMFANIALKTHAPVEAVIGLGVQIARSSASYKLSATQIGDAVQTIFNTFRLNGSDPATISNVTKDLKEIFSLGVVQGRQFRAVILQDQAEALLLAKHIHATGTDAAKVNKELDAIRAKGAMPDIYEFAMKHKGAFRGADVLNANIEGKADTDAKVAQLPTTLSQAFTDFYTKWLSFLNTLSSSGVFTPLVNFVEYLANNLPTIAVMLLAVGGAIGSLYAISTVTSLFQKFFLLVTSEAGLMVLPLILFGAVLAAVFGPQLNKSAQAMGGWGEFIIRTLSITVAILQTLFGNLGTVVMNAFFVIGKGVITAFQFVVNAIIDGINFLSTKLNSILPKGMQLGAINHMDAGPMTNPYAPVLQNDFQKHLKENYSMMEGAFGAHKDKGTPEFLKPPPPEDNNTAVKAAKDRANAMRNALQDLENMLAQFAGPAVKFQDDIAKMTTKIEDLTHAGHDAKGNAIAPLLTDLQVATAFANAGFKDYNATTHQSASYNDAMARSVMGLKNTDIDLAHAQDMANAALKIGAVTAGEAAEYIKKVKLANDLYNLSLDDTIANGIKIAQLKFNDKKDGPAKIAEAITTKALGLDQASDVSTYNTQLATLNQLVASGVISNEAYVKSLQDIQKAYLATKTDAMSGFQRGLLDIQQSMFDVSGDAAKVMTDTFNGLNDALVNFATTGKIDFRSMATSILKDMDSLIIKTAIMQPLLSVLGLAPGANGGAMPGSGGGFMNLMGSMFGGAAGGANQLGANALTPMYVSVVPGVGGLPGMSGSGGGGLMDMFDKGGFFSNLFNGGGGAGSASGGILSAFQGIGSFLGFKDGADFQVGGVGGSDSQLIAFRASPDERVTVQTPEQQRRAQKAQSAGTDMGGLHLHLHGVTDFDSFKKSKSQIATGLAQITSRTVRRNGA